MADDDRVDAEAAGSAAKAHRRTAPRPRSLGDEQLIEALRAPGCPLCTHADRRVWRHLSGVLYELVTDVGFRERLVAGGGFCPRHTRLTMTVNREELGGATAAAILLRSVLGARREALRIAGDGRRAGRRLADATRSAWTCTACEHEEICLSDAIGSLVGHSARDPHWRDWLLTSAWCLGHVGRLATALHKADAASGAAFVTTQVERLAALDARLDGLVQHSSHDRVSLLTETELRSAGEAEAILAGSGRP